MPRACGIQGTLPPARTQVQSSDINQDELAQPPVLVATRQPLQGAAHPINTGSLMKPSSVQLRLREVRRKRNNAKAPHSQRDDHLETAIRHGHRRRDHGLACRRHTGRRARQRRARLSFRAVQRWMEKPGQHLSVVRRRHRARPSQQRHQAGSPAAQGGAFKLHAQSLDAHPSIAAGAPLLTQARLALRTLFPDDRNAE